MKIRYLTLFFLLFSGYINVFGQDTLKIEAIDAVALPEFNPEVSLTEKEALIIIRSICPFTFNSNVDKIIVIADSLQKDDLHYYAIKFNVPSRARRLRMISEDYITITYSLGDLQPEETKRLKVTGPVIPLWRKFINEGLKIFEQGKYEQAKTKFNEAMSVAMGTEIEETTVIIERAALCIDSKTKADHYYKNAQWCAAVTEYEKVIGANQSDTYCKEKYEAAHEKCMNTERIITGTVTNLQGQTVSGVSIVIEEQLTDKKGNIKYVWSKAIKTDTDGKFQVKVLMKTRKLQYWLYNFRKNEIGLISDSNVVNIVINDGSGGISSGNSSNSNNNNSVNSKSTTTNKRQSSLQPGGLNTRKISDK